MTSLRHLRSSTANKRPDPTAMVDGQLAMNYDIASPGLFFKDDNGTLIKVGPVHVGTTAPNVSPAAGGTAGNSIGEQWLDTTSGVYVLKVWDGSAWRSESGTFVDVSGDTMTGALTMANQQAVRFSETTANGSNYIALQANAALASNKTITLPDTTGTVVTTGDTGTVTSTMIANNTILNADVNASAAIAGTKVSPDFGSQTIVTTGIFSSAAGTAAAPSIAFTGDTSTGLWSPAADTIAASTGGSERLRIDSGGKLLIGTSTSTDYYGASAKSYITDQGGENLPLALETFRDDSAGAYLILGHSRSGTAGNYTILQPDDGLGLISFNGSDGTDLASVGATIKAEVDGTPGADDMPGRLVFSTTADGASSPTERMRISSFGVPLFFSSDTGIISKVTAVAGTDETLFRGSHTATSVTTGTDCIYIRSNGNVENTNNSYGAISDIKLKENIVDANSQWDDLKALQVRNYNFKKETGQQTHPQIGLVAQEAELVSPGLVSESPDRDADGNDLGTVTKSVNYSVLYMKAVKALQEAMERIETLEGMVAVNNITIDEQQHQLSTLAARLTALESA
jgi:hypothetical protein